MPHFDLHAYGARLFQRRESGLIIERHEVVVGDWKPQSNRCHENVSVYCLHDSSCEAIRGWIFFSFEYQLPYVQFTSHSIVKRNDGMLWDITPAQTFQLYPFIPAEESEEEYATLIEVAGIQYLQVELLTAKVSAFGAPLGS